MDKLAELNSLPEDQLQAALGNLLKKDGAPEVQPNAQVPTPNANTTSVSGPKPEEKKSAAGSDAASGMQSGDHSREAKAWLQSALKAFQEEGESNAAKAAEAITAAQQAQIDADRQQRVAASTSPLGGSVSAPGSAGKETLAPAGALPQVHVQGTGDWGNLPKRTAQDLMESKREGSPPEYRAAVEAYFRAVAEKARPAPNRP